MKALYSYFKSWFVLAAVAIISLGNVMPASAPTGGDYVADITQYFVNNPAQQKLNTINQILCVIAKTDFSEFNGQGPYLALVNRSACDMSGDSSGSNDPSQAGQNQQNLMQLIIDANRQGGGAESAEIWVTDTQNNGQGGQMSMLIRVHLTVNSSPTTENIYGDFAMNYAGYIIESNGAIGEQIMRGYLASNGNNSLSFVESSELEHSSTQISVVQESSTIGYARIASNDMWRGPSDLTTAFSADHLLIDSDGAGSNPAICYDRNQFTNVVYSYGLYDNNGARVSNDSGFPITYNGTQGWIGYYGLWLPTAVLPENGATITKVHSDGTTEAGSLVATSGIMQVNARVPYTLADLAGAQINVNSSLGGVTNTSDALQWDANTQQFSKIGTTVCNQNGCNFSAQTPVVVSQSYFESIATNFGNNVNVWISGLGRGGSTQLRMFESCVQQPWNGGIPSYSCSGYQAPSNTTILNVWQNNVDTPLANAESMVLYCVDNCPIESDGNFITIQPAFNTQPPYYESYTYMHGLNGGNGYVLIDSEGNRLVQNSESAQPIFSGALLTESQLAVITESGMPGGSRPQPWLIYGSGLIGSYYQWISGGQTYNRYYSFQYTQTDNHIASFSAPLQLSYINESTGTTSFLQYNGFGNLQGIPGICQDESTGNVVNCNGGGARIWVPSYTIPNGSALSLLQGNGTTYWVKALNVAQILTPQNVSLCNNDANLNIGAANTLTLPTINSWSDPGDPTKPSGSDSLVPSVIDGVIQH